MLCHQLAPEFELVVADRLGELVDEAFEVNGVVIDVHATPEAGLNMGVAHRMIDEDVGNRVADGRFRAARIQACERRRVALTRRRGLAAGSRSKAIGRSDLTLQSSTLTPH